MGFVKAAEEIAAIERAFGEPHFVRGERFLASFLTEPSTYARLLPSCFTPADEPLVTIGIGRWQSNCVGDYAGGSVSLAVRHKGTEGSYAVSMWMDNEAAVAFGRDVLGEPKKLATTNLIQSGDYARAWIERRGVRLVDIEAVLGEDLGPVETERIAYNIRSRPAADGIGLEGPAVLTAATFRAACSLRRQGRGSVTLRGTPHDPVDELEVVAIVGAEYQQHDIVARCEAVDTISAEEFLPFHYGRTDNYAILDTEAARAR